MANYIEKLWADIGNISGYKAIGRAQIEAFGYKFSKTFINVFRDKKDKVPAFVIYEILDEDTNKPVSFSYLLYTERKSGLVLKNPFQHYFKMVEDCK